MLYFGCNFSSKQQWSIYKGICTYIYVSSYENIAVVCQSYILQSYHCQNLPEKIWRELIINFWNFSLQSEMYLGDLKALNGHLFSCIKIRSTDHHNSIVIMYLIKTELLYLVICVWAGGMITGLGIWFFRF
jgi:hypothetical protein